MAATARDVAQAAGVSVSTVSRALAGSDVVAERTRERVRSAAEELGYVPRLALPQLTPGATHTIGLVAPDISNPYFAKLAKVAQSVARSRGYRLLLADTDEDTSQEIEIALDLRSHVDGIVMCSPRAESAQLSGLAESSKVVFAGRDVAGFPSVMVDEAEAVGKVLFHLRALGHTRIAYVGGPSVSTSEARRSGALRELCEADGIEVLHVGNFRPYAVGGFAAADIAVSSGATAVIAFNDLLAVGILSRLRERGVRVPEDMSVTGFDDVLVADAVSPALTTIALPVDKIGTTALNLLLRYLESDEAPDSPPALPAELVVRASTGVAPTTRGDLDTLGRSR